MLFPSAEQCLLQGYLLTRKEGRTGTPEQPLSDLGMVLYYNYWKTAVYKYAFERPNERHRIESKPPYHKSMQ